MKYDPLNELTDIEVSALGEKDFFEYLDTKANHLKQFTRPLEGYHTKRFASAGAVIEGRELTTNELEAAKKIGKDNFNKRMETEAKVVCKLGGDPKFKDEGIKNIKTHRSQWFD